jgi:hypothetical protein
VFAVPTEDSNSPDLRSGRLSARVLLLPSHGFPQWLPFGPALSRFGAALSRTVLSSRSIPFSPPPAEHPGKTQLHIFGMLFFRLYHTAGAGKSLLFFACLFAGNGRLGRTENPPLSCGAWQGRAGGIAYAASLVMFMSTFAPIARVAVPFGLKAPLEPAR